MRPVKFLVLQLIIVVFSINTYSQFRPPSGGVRVMSVSPSSVHLDGIFENGTSTFSLTVDVDGDDPWQPVSNVDWLITSPFPETGDATIIITANSNLSFESRTGIIDIERFTITVTQDAGYTTPEMPPVPTITQNCGSTDLIIATAPPSKIKYYWQTTANGTSKSNSSTIYTVTNSGTYYLRAVIDDMIIDPNNPELGWSDSRAIGVTVTPQSVGGTVTGGSTICEQSSTGTLTLSGHTGSIARWQKKLNSGSWTNISSTSTTFLETPSSTGTWYYRAVIKSGTCPEAYSSYTTVTVQPQSVGGSISGTNSVCYGEEIGTLTLSGYTGQIVRWQKRQNSGSWLNISNTISTYNVQTLQSGLWEFRAEIKSGNCSSTYSSIHAINVYSLPSVPVITYDGSPEICQAKSLTLTASESDNYVWSTGETTREILVATSGNYYVTAVSQNGCESASSSSVSITVSSIVDLTFPVIPDDVGICNSEILLEGEQTQGTFTGNGISYVSGDYYFSAVTAGEGTHTLTYSNNNIACSNPATKQIEVIAPPEVSFDISETTRCLNEGSLLLEAQPTGGIYTINDFVPGDKVILEPDFTFDDAGTFNVNEFTP
ncbi:MAG: BACON domain-containing protein, partial [Bacteroidales bacterium]|nr:BACON domain-containing protein [Bacteroidales bacterium]